MSATLGPSGLAMLGNVLDAPTLSEASLRAMGGLHIAAQRGRRLRDYEGAAFIVWSFSTAHQARRIELNDAFEAKVCARGELLAARLSAKAGTR